MRRASILIKLQHLNCEFYFRGKNVDFWKFRRGGLASSTLFVCNLPNTVYTSGFLESVLSADSVQTIGIDIK